MKKSKQPSDPAVLIDQIAEEHGVARADVLRFPAWLKAAGLNPKKVTLHDCHRAEGIHRRALSEILTRHRALSSFPVVSLDDWNEHGPVVKKPSGRQEIFGHSVVALIRWMGDEDWNFHTAKMVLEKLGVETSGGTIRNALRAGREGTAEIPVLKLHERKELAALARSEN